MTEQLLEIVLSHTRQANAEQVQKVNLVLGELTSFVGESIQFYFGILSKGTEAEKATLSITHIPAMARCHQCQREFRPEKMAWFCPDCHGPIDEVIRGREFFIESIEVE